MKEFTLITGASGGIGECLARICAKKGENLILVARNKEKLDSLCGELREKRGVEVVVIVKDLSLKDAAADVYAETKAQNLTVGTLINNAGFGDWGEYVSSDWQKQADMIQLNVTALMQFCHLYCKDMKERRCGRVLNLASVASFSAGPYMSAYYASKSFVLSFSQALHEELKRFGVTVTALCPGPTATNFENRAGIKNKRLFSGAGNKEKIAAAGYRAMKKGKAICVAGKYSSSAVFGSRICSRRTCRKFVGKLNRGSIE